ncbi:MAG: histidine kinase [Eubacteriales bacterium]|nr:histidine kinase [Eubacteriales bacterium]
MQNKMTDLERAELIIYIMAALIFIIVCLIIGSGTRFVVVAAIIGILALAGLAYLLFRLINNNKLLNRIENGDVRGKETKSEKELMNSLSKSADIYGSERIATWKNMLLAPYLEDSVNAMLPGLNEESRELIIQEIENIGKMFKRMPGGFHRCYLSDPIHVEYINDGLCSMLGYGQEEIMELIKGDYCLLIHEDDRPAFEDFAVRLSEKEAKETIEYRMYKKNGEIITVSDTMESVRSSRGIMYGYSVIADISQKAEELMVAKQVIKEGSERERVMIEEQGLLATAARRAYLSIYNVNLTQNTYHCMVNNNLERFSIEERGSFDNLIRQRLKLIGDEVETERFFSLFGRENLLTAYERGEKAVSGRFLLTYSDGEEKWDDVNLIYTGQDKEGNVQAIALVSDADKDQKQLMDLQENVARESIYREALMSNCIGYMEVNFTKNHIDNCYMVWDDPTGLIKEIDETMRVKCHSEYDAFEKWWAKDFVLSSKEAYIQASNTKYFISEFEAGHKYVEVQSQSRYFNNEVIEALKTYILSKDVHTGDIKGICIYRDVTEQEKLRKELVVLEEELRDARIKNSVSQMQPHFLYNALASIREIVLDDPEYASDLILDFTTHLRACIKTMSSNDLIPFSKELENIKAYANIEKMRFGDRLNIKYDIRCRDFPIVPLSVQPLVENSIRHGIFECGAKGGTVTVSAYEENGSNVVTVIDNGAGFDYEKVKQEIENGERDSTGLFNTVLRLEKILGADVTIESSVGNGTTVKITIPNNKDLKIQRPQVAAQAAQVGADQGTWMLKTGGYADEDYYS